MVSTTFPVVSHTTAAHVNPAASISSNARSAGLCASTVNGGAATSPRSATVTSSASVATSSGRRLDVRGSRFERRRTSKSPPRTSCAIRPRGRGRARRRDDTRGRRGRRGKNTRRTVRGRRFARSSGRPRDKRRVRPATRARASPRIREEAATPSRSPRSRGTATRVSCAGRRRGVERFDGSVKREDRRSSSKSSVASRRVPSRSLAELAREQVFLHGVSLHEV